MSPSKVQRPQLAAYRLFDLADEIDLDRLPGPRDRLLRARSGAVQFERPPATLDLGERTVGGGDGSDPRTGRLTARLYDFGVAVLRWRTQLGDELDWQRLTAEVDAIEVLPELRELFEREVAVLEETIGPALLHPVDERLTEEFTAVHLAAVEGVSAAELLARPAELAPLVLGEPGEHAAGVHRDLARFAFGYTPDDLAVLGFDRVLIIDPEEIWDVADLVELAHAELIELAFYNRLVARELEGLPKLLGRRTGIFPGGQGRLRRRLLLRVAELTEVKTRLAGALTVTEDLFYAKIHRTAMDLYGATELAQALEEKIEVLGEVYGMLSDEAAARRAEVLEAGIFLLVLIEVVKAFF